MPHRDGKVHRWHAKVPPALVVRPDGDLGYYDECPNKSKNKK